MVADGERHANQKVEDEEGQKERGADNLLGRILASRMAERDKKDFSKDFGKTVGNIGSLGIAGGQQNEPHKCGGHGNEFPILDNDLHGQRRNQKEGESIERERFAGLIGGKTLADGVRGWISIGW